MKRNNDKPGTDGFVSRRKRTSIGDFTAHRPMQQRRSRASQPVRRGGASRASQATGRRASKQDLYAQSGRGLSKIDNVSEEPKRRGLFRRKKQPLAAKGSRFKKILKRTVVSFALIGVVIVGYLVTKGFWAINNVIDRPGEGALALQQGIDPTQLSGEGDGRVNIMLVGIGGEEHVAGDLADTIIIASIDPFAHEIAMLSIPRDMYVDIPGYWSTKVNAAHSIGESEGFQEEGYPDGGIGLLQRTIEETLDIPIHYYTRADFEAFKQAVDAVGGVDITLEEPVWDPNFDWQYGKNALNLPAGDVHLDGVKALLLSRARGATGLGIGVERGDFSRGERQRDILTALANKVLTLGTFSNPVKISNLLSAIGNHVRTNMQLSEMLRVYEIAESVDQSAIISAGLDNSPDNYLVSQSIGGASTLVPRGGDYSAIQAYVRSIFVDGFLRDEKAGIDVRNASSIPGLAAETAETLESYGYTVIGIDNAGADVFDSTVIYDLSDGSKPYTKRYLEQRFNLQMQPSSAVPVDVTSEGDFLILLGNDAAA